ncbi:MAG: DUF1641 domain-containing protein [Kofleriaceae bacterium]
MVAQSTPQASREDRLIATIERLERRIEAMEGTLRSLETATAQVPAVVATVTDIADGVVERLRARGIDIDDRMRALLRAMDHLTSPRALDALASMLASEIMAHQTTEVIGRVGRAIVAADREAKPVGMWGLWRALRDPEIQRAAGFLVAMARRFGEELESAPQLPPGGEE